MPQAQNITSSNPFLQAQLPSWMEQLPRYLGNPGDPLTHVTWVTWVTQVNWVHHHYALKLCDGSVAVGMTIIIIAFSSNPFFTHSTSILNGTNQINISMAKCGLSWWKMTCKEELKLTRTCLKSVEVKGGEKIRFGPWLRSSTLFAFSNMGMPPYDAL